MTDLRERILQDLRKSGFPLEIQVGSLFANRGWAVRHQAIFRDGGDEPRYVDILATKATEKKIGQYNRLNFMVVCECKKSEERPWIFYVPGRAQPVPRDMAALSYFKTLSEPPLDVKDRVSLAMKTRYMIRNPMDNLAQASHLAFWRDRPERRQRDYNQINGAINQVLKATTYQMQSVGKMLPLVSGILMLIIPLIVVDGRIFEYDLAQNGEPSTKETSHVKYQATVKGPETTIKLPNERTERLTPQEEFLIDIVEKKTLPNYIDWLEEDMRLIAN